MIFLNPWILASAVFALIGLADEFQKEGGEKPAALPPGKEPKASGDVSVVVNNDGTAVKSKGKPKSKPSGGVPSDPPGDG